MCEVLIFSIRNFTTIYDEPNYLEYICLASAYFVWNLLSIFFRCRLTMLLLFLLHLILLLFYFIFFVFFLRNIRIVICVHCTGITGTGVAGICTTHTHTHNPIHWYQTDITNSTNISISERWKNLCSFSTNFSNVHYA